MLPLSVLIGCQDLGLPGANGPEAEAARREWRYVVYDMTGAAGGQPEFVLGGTSAAGDAAGAAEPTRWLTSAEHLRIPDHLLRPVASTGGTTVYAMGWEQAPYSRLYTPAVESGTYHPLHRVLAPARPHESGETEPGAH
jgi:hypothetical protein